MIAFGILPLAALVLLVVAGIVVFLVVKSK
jgi:hypothetical protein